MRKSKKIKNAIYYICDPYREGSYMYYQLLSAVPIYNEHLDGYPVKVLRVVGSYYYLRNMRRFQENSRMDRESTLVPKLKAILIQGE